MESWTTQTQLLLEMTVLPTTRRRHPKKKLSPTKSNREHVSSAQCCMNEFPLLICTTNVLWFVRHQCGWVFREIGWCVWIAELLWFNLHVSILHHARSFRDSFHSIRHTRLGFYQIKKKRHHHQPAVKSFFQAICQIEILLFIWFEVIVRNHHAENFNFDFSQINCLRNAEFVGQSGLNVAAGPA